MKKHLKNSTTTNQKTNFLKVSALLAGTVLAANANAGNLPTGANVQAGNASINQAGSKMTVVQTTDKSIIDWKSFDVAKDFTVEFKQPSQNSSSLNRVTGDTPSTISGSVISNGKVFLVNPNGILFSKSGVVDTSAFSASTLNIANEDFLNGKFSFTKDAGKKNALVENLGKINVSDGGFVALLGGAIKNDGTVIAHLGKVGFGAGEKVVLSFGDADFLRVEIGSKDLSTIKDASGRFLSAVISNNGDIKAGGGFVKLSVKSAKAALRQVINVSGSINARSVSEAGGTIVLGGGQIDSSGELNVSGIVGGTVDISADGLLSLRGRVLATGSAGSGGNISLKASHSVTFIKPLIDASGVNSGGSVKIVAGGKAMLSANIKADGSAGSGGFIDISTENDTLFLLNAKVSATGTEKGGRIRVGGQFQGGSEKTNLNAGYKNSFLDRWDNNDKLISSRRTQLGKGTLLDVSSTLGYGGTVVVWADDKTAQLGAINASGLTKGGSVEISGKISLGAQKLDNVVVGNGGYLLIDPKNVNLKSGLVLETDDLIVELDKTFNNGIGSVARDGNIIVLGTPSRVSGNAGTGEIGLVFVYYNNYGIWGISQLKSSGWANTGDGIGVGRPVSGYGTSVAIAGGVLAVGAVGSFTAKDTDITQNSGTVFLYPVDSEGRNSKDILTLGNEDYRLDGRRIKTEGEDTGIEEIGSDANSGVVVQTVNGLGKNHIFGRSVALNKDGTMLVVGAPGQGNTGGDLINDAKTGKGAVYIFSLDKYKLSHYNPRFTKVLNEDVIPTKQLVRIDETTAGIALDNKNLFGYAVSIHNNNLAVGAPDLGTASNKSGTVYLMDITNPQNPTVSGTLNKDNSAFNSQVSVSLKGGDGFGSALSYNDIGQLAVGAENYNASAGAVFILNVSDPANVEGVLKLSSDTLSTSGVQNLPSLSAGSKFGQYVSFSGENKLIVNATHYFSIWDDRIKSIENQLNRGTEVFISASTDITVSEDITGNANLILEAGRSVIISSNVAIKTKGLFVSVNSPSMYSEANRDAGAAVFTMEPGSSINGQGRAVSITMGGLVFTKDHETGEITEFSSPGDSGAITVRDITASRLLINNIKYKSATGSAESKIVLKGTVTITNELKFNKSQSTILLVAKSIVNETGETALNPGSGRYILWTQNPSTATLGGIHYDFKQFGLGIKEDDLETVAMEYEKFEGQTAESERHYAERDGSSLNAKDDVAIPGLQDATKGNGILYFDSLDVRFSASNYSPNPLEKVYDGTSGVLNTDFKAVTYALDTTSIDASLGVTVKDITNGATLSGEEIGVKTSGDVNFGNYAYLNETKKQLSLSKSAYTAGGTGANKVVFTGPTATYEDAKGKPVYVASNFIPNEGAKYNLYALAEGEITPKKVNVTLKIPKYEEQQPTDDELVVYYYRDTSLPYFAKYISSTTGGYYRDDAGGAQIDISKNVGGNVNEHEDKTGAAPMPSGVTIYDSFDDLPNITHEETSNSPIKFKDAYYRKDPAYNPDLFVEIEGRIDATIDGVIGGDDARFGGKFTDADLGKNKPVDPSIVGRDGHNYELENVKIILFDGSDKTLSLAQLKALPEETKLTANLYAYTGSDVSGGDSSGGSGALVLVALGGAAVGGFFLIGGGAAAAAAGAAGAGAAGAAVGGGGATAAPLIVASADGVGVKIGSNLSQIALSSMPYSGTGLSSEFSGLLTTPSGADTLLAGLSSDPRALSSVSFESISAEVSKLTKQIAALDNLAEMKMLNGGLVNSSASTDAFLEKLDNLKTRLKTIKSL